MAMQLILTIPNLSYAGCTLPKDMHSWDKKKIYNWIKEETDIMGIAVAENKLKSYENDDHRWEATIIHIVFPEKFKGRTYELHWQKHSKKGDFILREEGQSAIIGRDPGNSFAFFTLGAISGERIYLPECVARAVGLIDRTEFMKIWAEDVSEQLRSGK